MYVVTGRRGNGMSFMPIMPPRCERCGEFSMTGGLSPCDDCLIELAQEKIKED